MKSLSFAFLIKVLLCSSAYSQSAITGTWRVEGAGRPFPWDVVLRADGSRVHGAVNSCFSNQGTIDIFDGGISGNLVTFKCRSFDGRRTLTFNGSVSGDEMEFTWTMQTDGPRDPLPDGLFGSAAPSGFTARRISDGELAQGFDRVRGAEFAAAVNVVPKDVKAEAKLFIPKTVDRVRALLVVINYGTGLALSVSPEWRKLSETVQGAVVGVRFSGITRDTGLGGVRDIDAQTEALLAVLQRLAGESGHQEVTNAPLLFWGHSGAADIATAFAGRLRERTLAFVRYRFGEALNTDLGLLREIPALFLSGGRDANASANTGAQNLWKKGRAMNAPWALATDPDAPHGDDDDHTYLKRALGFMTPWITSVARRRLTEDGTGLRPVSDQAAWIGDNGTGAVTSVETFSGAKRDVSWLPDETSARAWRVLIGAAK